MQLQNVETVTDELGDRRKIEDFLIHEVALLDDRRFEDWRDLFAEDGRYWVPLKPGQEFADGESSLFDDDRSVMATRFERLRHPNIHSQNPPHRTCHVVGNVVIGHVDVANGEVSVSSRMIMTDYRMQTQRVFSGRVTHRLRRAGPSYKIALKRVDLINCDDTFELIAVPF
jgi:3-phenylpropionate/cinnamic acid dioxygenase small subunit